MMTEQYVARASHCVSLFPGARCWYKFALNFRVDWFKMLKIRCRKLVRPSRGPEGKHAGSELTTARSLFRFRQFSYYRHKLHHYAKQVYPANQVPEVRKNDPMGTELVAGGTPHVSLLSENKDMPGLCCNIRCITGPNHLCNFNELAFFCVNLIIIKQNGVLHGWRHLDYGESIMAKLLLTETLPSQSH